MANRFDALGTIEEEEEEDDGKNVPPCTWIDELGGIEERLRESRRRHKLEVQEEEAKEDEEYQYKILKGEEKQARDFLEMARITKSDHIKQYEDALGRAEAKVLAFDVPVPWRRRLGRESTKRFQGHPGVSGD